MKASMTREKYRGRLAKFFDFIGLIEGTMEGRAKAFTERGKRQPDWVFQNVLHFAQAQKERVANGEISPATLRNYIKAVKHSTLQRDYASIPKAEDSRKWTETYSLPFFLTPDELLHSDGSA
jgi:hypothetical protein